MNQPKTKGHGYFRKSKAYGLIPILALGTLAIMGNTVSADETVPTTPTVTTVTTLDPQPAPSKDNIDLAQEAGHQTGELISAIPSPDLDQEVMTATDAGVVVTKEETVTHDSLAKAQADLDKQTQALKETTKNQQDLDTAQAKAKAAAQKAGVIVTEGETKTYTDIEAAQADLDKQTEALKTATETQTKAQVELAQALQAAKAQGVTVQLAKAVTYSDSLKALEALNTQLAQLDKVNQSQVAADQLLLEAIKTAQAKGLVITTKDKLKTRDLAQALELIKKQVASLSALESTKEELNQKLEAIKTKASEAGVIVTETPVKTYTDQERAKADTTKAMTALETILKAQAVDDQTTKTAQSEANQKLEEAKAKATQAGLIITTKEAITITDPKLVSSNVQDQLAKLDQAIKVQEEAKTILAAAEAKVKQSGTQVIDGGTVTVSVAEAKDKAQELAKAMAAVVTLNQEVVAKKAELERIKQENTKIEAENRATMEGAGLTYTGNYAKDLATVEAYNKTGRFSTHTETEVIGDTTGFDAANAKGKAIDGQWPAAANGYTPSGSSNFNQAQRLKNGVEVVADGTLTTNGATVYVKGEVDEAKLVSKVLWKNGVALEGEGIRRFTPKDNNDIWGNTYNYQTGGADQFFIAKTKKWYKVKDLVTTADGKVHDGYLMFDSDPAGLHPAYDGSEVAVWNSNGAINALDGGTTGGVNQQSDGIRTTISLDKPDNQDGDIIWVSLMSDFDGGQYIDDSKTMTILGVGGGFKTNAGVGHQPLAVDENLGYTYGKNTSANALNGFDSAPDGTALFVQTGTYSTVLRNTPGGNASAVARADFGSESSVKQQIIKTRKVVKEKPEIQIKPTLPVDKTPEQEKSVTTYRLQVTEDLTPIKVINDKTYEATLTPVTFDASVQGVTLETSVTPLVMSASLQPVTLKTAVHPVQVTQKPINVKHVINSDTVDINGQTIPKGSTVTWTLTNNPLEAGRDKVTAYTLKDPLPAGFELDLEASMTASPDWLFTQEESGKLTITASQALLTKLNANRDQAVALPMVSLVGRVLHDNGSYQNTFKTLITTPSGSYTVVSNTPKITTPTPPRPVKSITDQAGANLNGASTFDKHVTFHLMTDYSPYRLVTVSQDMISKGFVILDDVEDGAYTIDEAKIAITASDKTDVKDLFTMYHVLSNEARTEAIQAILDQAGLSPVGEFYLWVAKDPASFYTHYVKQAKNMTIDLPARLLVKAGEVVTNDFFQGDFGNTYQSNLVTVQVPDVNPAKHALDKENDTKILDGQEVNIGEYIRYFLDGVTVPVKHDTLWQYEGKDKLDTTHDRYTGHWKGFIKGTEYTAKEDLVLAYDVTTKDGQLIKAGETIPAGSTYAFSFTFDQDTNSDFIKKIVTVTWDKEKGEWSYQIDKAFLNSLGVEGIFDADFYLEVERIASGKVDNTFVNIVNGKEMSAKVTTHTPEQPQPVTPKAPALPSTGEQGVSVLTVLGAALLSLLGYVGLKKRQQ
ncbi:SspB-related isopeptide-forming adhesin [Streptococcus equi]|uniref:SspB-related isopeptide-forming adhesin n=1 Tax=Streptococcus equi TaxID=1336 RepID=UPI001E4E9D33|nr:SspB-related isopeptide-forming adhesin [Streptococcus equi]